MLGHASVQQTQRYWNVTVQAQRAGSLVRRTIARSHETPYLTIPVDFSAYFERPKHCSLPQTVAACHTCITRRPFLAVGAPGRERRRNLLLTPFSVASGHRRSTTPADDISHTVTFGTAANAAEITIAPICITAVLVLPQRVERQGREAQRLSPEDRRCEPSVHCTS